MAERPFLTGYEPKQLAEYKDHQLLTEDEHFSEHQDLAEHVNSEPSRNRSSGSESQKQMLHLSHPHQEVEVRREKGVRGRSPCGKINRLPCKYFLKGTCTKLSESIGILPNVILKCQNRAVNSAKSARVRTGRLRNNQIKSRRRVVTKVQWLL